MARYDRIAPLSSPTRDHAFPAWPVLRDVEGQDRDADVCRRARLRFLALRPVRRLIDRGPAEVSGDSFSRQIETVREELSSLASRDVERVRITKFVRQVEDRDLRRVVAALVDYAEQAHAAGHVHAAEEYALTAEMAQSGVAQELLDRMRAQPGAEDDAAALENGWNELRQTQEPRRRAQILESIGRALLGLRLLTAADRCFAIIAQRPTDLSLRSRARGAHALIAGLAGDVANFRARRTALLNDDAEWAPDPRVAAGVHMDLAQGCLAVGDPDFAREHLRAAITIARRHNYAELLARAEGILTALEQNTEVLLQPLHASSEAAQRIAAQIELLELPAPVV
jgi:ribosomal protein L12E/L44/L45/RPP1/RPP2